MRRSTRMGWMIAGLAVSVAFVLSTFTAAHSRAHTLDGHWVAASLFEFGDVRAFELVEIAGPAVVVKLHSAHPPFPCPKLARNEGEVRALAAMPCRPELTVATGRIEHGQTPTGPLRVALTWERNPSGPIEHALRGLRRSLVSGGDEIAITGGKSHALGVGNGLTREFVRIDPTDFVRLAHAWGEAGSILDDQRRDKAWRCLLDVFAARSKRYEFISDVADASAWLLERIETPRFDSDSPSLSAEHKAEAARILAERKPLVDIFERLWSKAASSPEDERLLETAGSRPLALRRYVEFVGLRSQTGSDATDQFCGAS